MFNYVIKIIAYLYIENFMNENKQNEKLTDIRCSGCQSLFFKANIQEAKIEVKCRKCGTITVIEIKKHDRR